VVTRERGTVVSIIPSWHPTESGATHRRLRLLVEYDTDEGMAVVRTVTTDRPGLEVGSQVWVLTGSGGRITIAFDDLPATRPWWAGGQPVSGLLLYAGLVSLLLIVSGAIWYTMNSRYEDVLRNGPPGSQFSVPPTSPGNTPETTSAPPSASTTR
jgi:hypothetical protein